MLLSSKGLLLIMHFETCVLSAYPDPQSELGQACDHLGLPCPAYKQVPRWQLLGAQPVTVGWGHTGSARLGDTISQAAADMYLQGDTYTASKALDGLLLNQNQFDALVSLIYNIGVPAFDSSTLKQLLLAGDYDGAAEEFLKWNHSRGKVVDGLTNRRNTERYLFLSPVEPALLAAVP